MERSWNVNWLILSTTWQLCSCPLRQTVNWNCVSPFWSWTCAWFWSIHPCLDPTAVWKSVIHPDGEYDMRNSSADIWSVGGPSQAEWLKSMAVLSDAYGTWSSSPTALWLYLWLEQVILPWCSHFSSSIEWRLEKGMAAHSSVLSGRIPWTEEPGGLQFMWLQRVRHDWSDLACIEWR